MQKPLKVLYVGMHPGTLEWISSQDVSVTAVSKLDYFSQFTLNPANLLFISIYFLRARLQTLWPAKVVYFSFFWIAKPFLSELYKKYADYLRSVMYEDISIWDMANHAGVADRIREKFVDLIVMNSWSILPDEVINTPRLGTINIHPSRLPEYKGALPTLWTLKNGDKESAVTYFLVNGGVDAGHIISQHTFSVNPDDNWLSLERKIESVIQRTLAVDVVAYARKTLVPKPQIGKGSVTGKYHEYRKIDWKQEKAKDIFDKVNLYPYLEPFFYCTTELVSKVLEIRKIRLAEIGGENLAPGSFKVKGLNLLIGASDGTLICRLFKDVSLSDSLALLRERGAILS